MSVCRRRKKWVGKKGQKPQNLQKWVLGAVRCHSRLVARSPLLDHTWFLVVISSNDRAILYRYRDIERYYVKNRKTFPTPRINYRVDLRHYLTDPYQIWWTCRLIITDWWTLLFSIFYFPSTLRVTGHNMLRLNARFGEIWGFSPLIFVRGHF